MTTLTPAQRARLGGLAVSRGKSGRKHMKRLSALAQATRKAGDRTLPTFAEIVATKQGRRELDRICTELGTTREDVLRVTGAQSRQRQGVPLGAPPTSRSAS